MIKKLIKTCKRALENYGWQEQFSQKIEESCELNVELSHAKRKDRTANVEKIKQEVIHDLIVNIQVCLTVFTSTTEFKKHLYKELERLDKRLDLQDVKPKNTREAYLKDVLGE